MRWLEPLQKIFTFPVQILSFHLVFTQAWLIFIRIITSAFSSQTPVETWAGLKAGVGFLIGVSYQILDFKKRGGWKIFQSSRFLSDS